MAGLGEGPRGPAPLILGKKKRNDRGRKASRAIKLNHPVPPPLLSSRPPPPLLSSRSRSATAVNDITMLLLWTLIVWSYVLKFTEILANNITITLFKTTFWSPYLFSYPNLKCTHSPSKCFEIASLLCSCFKTIFLLQGQTQNRTDSKIIKSEDLGKRQSAHRHTCASQGLV